ncbi:MAG: GTPase Era [Clostridia bacterium]|nr:GTPase Era [Clostridia bacterium]
MQYKSGFIGIVGRPNVGKSTLMNAILGEKIVIMSDKPQTTRNAIRGVYTEDNAQLIFIDTPGIHKPKNKLGEYMTDMALRTLEEVDIILLIVDERADFGPGDEYVLEALKNVKTPKFLIINKIDLIEPKKFEEIYHAYDKMNTFQDIFGVSALSGKNVAELIEQLKETVPEGPMFFPEDILTDQHEKFLVGEIIREKTLQYLQDEVPHGVAVDITSMKEKKDIINIQADIYCEKKSHKGIIIGKEGRKLKGIGKSARIEIEALLGTKVFLEIWVKVRPNWRENSGNLKNFGYYR